MRKLIISTMAILVMSSSVQAKCYVGRGQWDYGTCDSMTFDVPMNANTYQILKINMDQGFTGKRCRRNPRIGDVHCCYYENGKKTHCD